MGQKTILLQQVSRKAGISRTATVALTVLKNYIPTAEPVTMPTDDATKTWKVDSVQVGHLGVGPLGTFTSDYWLAPPNDKVGLGIYDDEYTFTKTGNVFSHKTNNSIFGHKDALKDFDPTLTGTGDYTLTGTAAANYTEPFAYDGVGATEYIIFSNKGHMGLYVGARKFQVQTKSYNQMSLRSLGIEGLAWYVKIKAK